jgi:hypothetical protein
VAAGFTCRTRTAAEGSPGRRIAARFLGSRVDERPVVEEHVREVEPEVVKRILAGVGQVRRAIESGVFHPAPSTMNCSGCGYRAVCRARVG